MDAGPDPEPLTLPLTLTPASLEARRLYLSVVNTIETILWPAVVCGPRCRPPPEAHDNKLGEVRR